MESEEPYMYILSTDGFANSYKSRRSIRHFILVRWRIRTLFQEYNRKIEKVVNVLAGQLHLLECNDYEKELRVHDWICRNIEYAGKTQTEVGRALGISQVQVSRMEKKILRLLKGRAEGELR